MSAWEVAALVAIGVATGVVSGLLGVGGGLLMVPALSLAFGFDQHLAEGTSLLVIIPTAGVGALTHARHGFVRLRHAVVLGGGGILGAVAGSGGALALDADTLRYLFAGFLVVVGIRMIVSHPKGPEDHPAGAVAGG